MASRKFPALFILLGLAPMMAHAADSFFVRPYVAGSANGSGLDYDNAWNGFISINWATVNAGDTLYICGSHQGYGSNRLDVPKSGNPGPAWSPENPGNRITIAGDCVDGSGVADPGAIFNTGNYGPITPDSPLWRPYSDGIYKWRKTGETGFAGSFLLQEAGAPPSLANPGTRVKWARRAFVDPLDPANLPYWPDNHFFARDELEPDGQTVSTAIYFKPGGSCLPHPDCPPSQSLHRPFNGDIIYIVNQAHLVIRDLTLYAGHGRTFRLSNGDDIVIYNNKSFWSGVAIEIRNDSDNGIIRNNVVNGSIQGGIWFDPPSVDSNWNLNSNDGWVVAGNALLNISRACRYCGLGVALDRHALAVRGAWSNNTIELNDISGAGGEAILIYNDSNKAGGIYQQNNTIRYNFIRDVKDFRAGCTPTSGTCSSQMGLAFNSDSGPANPVTISGNVVHHNVFARIEGKAIRSKSTKPKSGYTWSYLNNTIVDAGSAIELIGFGGAGGVGGLEFRNNIVYDGASATQSGPHVIGNRLTDVSGFAMSNNIYYPDGPDQFQDGEPAGSPAYNLAGWVMNRAGIGEAGSSTVDPNFVDPTETGTFAWIGSPPDIEGAGNFQLTTAPTLSWAFNSGAARDLSSDADILGNPRAGRQDRGAYELLYADLGITIAYSPDPVVRGQTLTYTATVTNAGPITATGVTATGLGMAPCGLGTMISGASAQCVWTVNAPAVGTLTRTMAVAAAEVDLNTANNSATSTPP